MDLNLFITVPLDARVLDGTRPSAGAVPTTKSCISFSVMKFHWLPPSNYCCDVVFHRHTINAGSTKTKCKINHKWMELNSWGWDKIATIFRRHQAITWINADWSSVKSSDIHIRAISQEMPQPSITKTRFKITYLKFHSNFPGANELKK